MSASKFTELMGKLFVEAPYLASLIFIACLFGYGLYKLRNELKKDIKVIEEKLEHKIEESRARDLIRAIVNPVIMGLKGIKKISADNAGTLKELGDEVHELSKDSFGAETNIENLKGQVKRLEDKVYD